MVLPMKKWIPHTWKELSKTSLETDHDVELMGLARMTPKHLLLIQTPAIRVMALTSMVQSLYSSAPSCYLFSIICTL